MNITWEGLPLEFDPRLVEEAILAAAEAASQSENRAFRQERDAVYEIEIADIRESSFQQLDARWFTRFGVADALLGLLGKHPLLAHRTSGGYVLFASSSRDEGADLHAPQDELTEKGLPVLVIRLLPNTLLDRGRLSALLRHELLHVTDMLDPDFGYEPVLPETSGGPMLQRLIQDRYRVLWSTTIDGRLAGRGELSSLDAERRRQEFLTCFTMLGAEAEGYFQRFFEGPRPKHSELVSFALEPRGSQPNKQRLCPLCNLPASNLHLHPRGPCTVDVIQKDFPQWKQEMGLCLQCADLYDARAKQTLGSLGG
jgi:hypothetical protein